MASSANYNKTYGAIGGVIVMLLWLWSLNMSLRSEPNSEPNSAPKPNAAANSGRNQRRGNHPAPPRGRLSAALKNRSAMENLQVTRRPLVGSGDRERRAASTRSGTPAVGVQVRADRVLMRAVCASKLASALIPVSSTGLFGVPKAFVVMADEE
ncbi:hypothetical protein [Arthrobacter sp. GN70]|uniref:hypothetical protein n=1 Tax=Arthrobacter sp. GN70 TaxID=2838876 RepID=UPI0035A8D3AE